MLVMDYDLVMHPGVGVSVGRVGWGRRMVTAPRALAGAAPRAPGAPAGVWPLRLAGGRRVCVDWG